MWLCNLHGAQGLPWQWREQERECCKPSEGACPKWGDAGICRQCKSMAIIPFLHWWWSWPMLEYRYGGYQPHDPSPSLALRLWNLPHIHPISHERGHIFSRKREGLVCPQNKLEISTEHCFLPSLTCTSALEQFTHCKILYILLLKDIYT